MEGIKRRKKLLYLLEQKHTPISGTELSKLLGVSRQVIVQDIALLRANNKNILSTNKGYMLFVPDEALGRVRRSFAMHHSEEQMKEELYTIVDYGGMVQDVVVAHDIYGQITVDLILKNRLDVDEFMKKIENSNSNPLSLLTGGDHWHTVEADSEEVLDYIQNQLMKKGLLQNDLSAIK